MRRRWLGDWTGAPARLAEAVIGLALLIGILELLGAVRAVRARSDRDRVRARRRGRMAIAEPTAGRRADHARGEGRAGAHPVALLAGATVIAEWGALTIQSYDVGIRGFDSLWYHLPVGGELRADREHHLAAVHRRRVPDAVLSGHRRDAARARDRAARARHAVAGTQPRVARRSPCSPRTASGDRAASAPPRLIGAALAMATHDDGLLAGRRRRQRRRRGVLPARRGGAADDRRPSTRPRCVLAAVAAGLAVGVKLTVLAPVLALTVGVVAIAPRGRRLAHGRRCGSAR